MSFTSCPLLCLTGIQVKLSSTRTSRRWKLFTQTDARRLLERHRMARRRWRWDTREWSRGYSAYPVPGSCEPSAVPTSSICACSRSIQLFSTSLTRNLNRQCRLFAESKTSSLSNGGSALPFATRAGLAWLRWTPGLKIIGRLSPGTLRKKGQLSLHAVLVLVDCTVRCPWRRWHGWYFA